MKISLKTKIFGSIILSFVILFVTFALSNPQKVGATAPAGLNAQVSTSSTLQVGPGNNMYAFGTTTNESRYQCAARIITTTTSAITISFASLSSTSLSTTIGHSQATSTTVSYDGGLYGCGYMTIRGAVASSTITLSETH